MVNYLSPFIPNKAEMTEHFRQLVIDGVPVTWGRGQKEATKRIKAVLSSQVILRYYDENKPLTIQADASQELVKDGVPVTWGRAQKEATKRIKAVLSSPVILRYYDENKPLTIQADASQDGLGTCLLQEGQPVSYASRSMTDTEKRYAQIEKEMLAIIFATQRFHHYIYGIDVTVLSYHKPLESIQHKELSKVSPRLQNMLMKLLWYRINIVYKPGKQMHIADTLSRAHLQSKSPAADLDFDMKAVHTFMYETSSKALNEYKKATLQDEVSQQMRRYLKGKWLNRKTLSSELQMYYDLREQI